MKLVRETVERSWGKYHVLWRSKRLCIKILVFNDRARLSLQRHSYRKEFWFILNGAGRMTTYSLNLMEPQLYQMDTYEYKLISKNVWHQFTAFVRCRVLEIQYGSQVREDDIQRAVV